jgi:L,D-transpeptidase ErfK/SrfK
MGPPRSHQSGLRLLKSTIGGHEGGSIAAAVLLLLSMITGLAFATPHTEDISTVNLQYAANKNESLHEIARKFDLGVNELVNANPGVDPFVPGYGSIVQIPVSRILPEVPVPAGIIVNLPEFRLYIFPSDDPETVLTFPIGIGDLGKDTPVGTYTVIEKIINPAWHVPESIRKEKPELPRVVPPGPDNPMGSHALRLSLGTVLIHGTDRPWGIGMRSSHGCLRLYPEDIVRLFKLVNLGTRVSIVNQPVKVAVKDEQVFVEVHGYENKNYRGEAIRLLREKKLLERVDMPKLTRALKEMSGMPVDITR